MEIKPFCSDVFIPSLGKAGGFVGMVWALADASMVRNENTELILRIAYFVSGIGLLSYFIYKDLRDRAVEQVPTESPV